MTHAPGGHSPHDHQQNNDHQHNDAWLLEVLELDASLLGPQLAAMTAWVQEHSGGGVRSIVDVGAGLGSGTLALAEQFPAAEVQAVDRSAAMLARVRDAAAERGLGERVATVQADLDLGWPPLSGVDLVWAASSLHEVADPARAFGEIFAALRPGGLLAVVELADLPWFLPDDVGLGDPGLEQRAHRVLGELGWNRQLEWERLLVQSGFELEQKAAFSAGAQHDAGAARHYAATYLRRIRPVLQQGLSAADLGALDAILAGADPGRLLHDGDLEVRVDRVAWAARRP
ncbi:MAG: methyltransferase domain-containing protein [Renibacterium sp.]|nr:methyltransferase domain-containing protein [Renibacterium sp.]